MHTSCTCESISYKNQNVCLQQDDRSLTEAKEEKEENIIVKFFTPVEAMSLAHSLLEIGS